MYSVKGCMDTCLCDGSFSCCQDLPLSKNECVWLPVSCLITELTCRDGTLAACLGGRCTTSLSNWHFLSVGQISSTLIVIYHVKDKSILHSQMFTNILPSLITADIFPLCKKPLFGYSCMLRSCYTLGYNALVLHVVLYIYIYGSTHTVM